MATSYQLSSTASDLTGGADFSNALVTSGATTGTLSVSIAKNATEISYGFTPAADPSVSGVTGNYTVAVNHTTGNSNITLSIILNRVNSAGTVQSSSSASTGQALTTAGTKTFTFSSQSLGTWASGDRLRVDYRFVNAANNAQSVTVGFNSSTTVSAPWTITNGTMAVSETGSDIASASGKVIVKGTMAAPGAGSDTASMSGKVTVKGTLAATETGSDTASASGKVLVKGSLSVTETGGDTASLQGKVLVKGSLSVSETGADTASASGKVLVKGSVSATETGADAATASGKVLVKGTASLSESGADTFASTGKTESSVSGTMAVAETGSDTAALSGKIAVQGSWASTEGGDTIAASGQVAVRGSLSGFETGSDALSVSGKVLVNATVAATETSSDTTSSSGSVLVRGSLAASESGNDVFWSGGARTFGTMDATELADRISVTGTAKRQEGGRNRGIGFVPLVEVTVKLKPTPRARASTKLSPTSATKGVIVRALFGGARGGSSAVIVYESVVSRSPRTASGTAKVAFKLDYTFTALANPRCILDSHYIPPADLAFQPEFVGATQGTVTPGVTAILNPTDDELMAIVRLAKQRRKQQLQRAYRALQ